MSVAFVREESAEAAQEVTLPERPISAHPNLVTQSGLKALERATAESSAALKAAQAIEEPNEKRRAVELAARDARYFSERLASAIFGPSRTASRRLRSAIASPSSVMASDAKPFGLSGRTRPIRASGRSPMSRRSRDA